jgi:hypothetical protein
LPPAQRYATGVPSWISMYDGGRRVLGGNFCLDSHLEALQVLPLARQRRFQGDWRAPCLAQNAVQCRQVADGLNVKLSA